MKLPFSMAVALVLSIPTATLAHEGGVHVMGTVTSIAPPSLVVQSTEGAPVTVHLDAATRYERSGTAATAEQLAVGERVVVHAMKHGAMLHATLVKWGKQAPVPAKEPAKADPPAGHGHGGHEGPGR